MNIQIPSIITKRHPSWKGTFIRLVVLMLICRDRHGHYNNNPNDRHVAKRWSDAAINNAYRLGKADAYWPNKYDPKDHPTFSQLILTEVFRIEDAERVNNTGA